MQQEWDDLDKSVFNSFKEIECSKDYNSKLISKIKNQNKGVSEKKNFAFSLILSGLLIIVMYTSNIQFELANIEYKIKSEILTFHYNFSNEFELLNKFLGE